MKPTRRKFLSEAALAAAIAGVGPGVRAIVAAAGQSPRPYLDLALRCAKWIDSSAQHTASGLAWPADPLKPGSIGLDYYNGAPGVVAFFARMWEATGDAKWADRALQGYEYLTAESARMRDALDAGLYTGLAGLGATYFPLSVLKVGPEAGNAVMQVTKDLVRRAKNVGDGVEWSDSNDIISGTAGTGLFLLDAAERLKDASLADLAMKAGRRLLATAVPAEGGLMWLPGGAIKANYPNFSHGTSGVAYFLATLYQRSKEQAFLDGALAGAKYLDAVATRRNGGRAIFHVTGGGEDRFYLSWCHGPVGTSRLFYRLLQITGDSQWRTWIDELTTWLASSGAPEQQSAGYWNNISQCCGNVGIGQYAIDLTRHYPKPIAASLRDRVVKNTMSRAKDDEAGLRWVQAENRVSPENLVAQTGFMQGAAGVGTFFLQLDALARGVSWSVPWPDTPWA
ncbi:MAG TPA: lanthionine synthetase LanC family protein [Vicinamibacterales bacterium]|nr:lanthionine synthetase LanC family protein [Vicinamibacterales bacterium]